MTVDMQSVSDIVWGFRAEMGDLWPCPDKDYAIRYAHCEALEAMDAWIRVTRPHHKRNHNRTPDVMGELADCAIMLITALGPNYQFNQTDYRTYRSVDTSIDAICWHVALAHRYLVNKQYDGWWWWAFEAKHALFAISSYPGMQLADQVQRRLDGIRRRRLGYKRLIVRQLRECLSWIEKKTGLRS